MIDSCLNEVAWTCLTYFFIILCDIIVYDSILTHCTCISGWWSVRCSDERDEMRASIRFMNKSPLSTLMTSLSIVPSTSAYLWVRHCLSALACCESLYVYKLFCSCCSVHQYIISSQSVVKRCVGVRYSNGSITQKIRLFLLTEHEGALFSPNVVKVMIHFALQWWYWVT